LYTTNTTGAVFLGTLENQIPKMASQLWFSADGAVESLALGQGVIAVAHGQKVDIVEGYKHVGKSFVFEGAL
jgi:hypothetical protein